MPKRTGIASGTETATTDQTRRMSRPMAAGRARLPAGPQDEHRRAPREVRRGADAHGQDRVGVVVGGLRDRADEEAGGHELVGVARDDGVAGPDVEALGAAQVLERQLVVVAAVEE